MTLTRAWLLGLSLCLAILRLPTLAEPPERDLTTYAIIGQGISEGRALYSDLWDHKPPGIHLTFLLAQSIAGETTTAIYVLAVVTSIATLVAIWRVCATLDPSLVASRWAGCFWVAASGAWLLAGNSPNTEAFVNAAFCWFLALLLAPPRGRTFLRAGLLAGILLLAASLYKHVVVIAAVPVAIAHVLWAESREQRALAVKDVAAWLLVGLLGWGILAAAMALSGSLDAAVDALFTYNAFYGGEILSNAWRNLQPDRLLRHETLLLVPLAMLSALAFLLSWRNHRRRVMLGIAFVVGMTLVIVTPELPYPHYKLLWIPAVCIGSGWAVAAAKEWAWRGWQRNGVTSIAALALSAVAISELRAYRYSGTEWSELRYNSVYTASAQLALLLREQLPHNCSFYQFGAETGLYFHSRIRPPVGVTYAMPLVAGPLAQRLVLRTVDDLRESRPCLVIVSSQFALPTQVAELIGSQYRPVGEPVPIDKYRSFTYYELIGTSIPDSILAWRYTPAAAGR